MEYNEIVDLALNYSDRQDNEVVDRMDNFLLMVESRVNRLLDVQKMSIRTVLTTQADQEYYGLPPDFNGLRDIEITSTDTPNHRETLSYLTPEQMNNHATNVAGLSNARIFYTIVANQIQIYPPQDTKLMEIVYYRKIPGLSAINTSNWASLDYPDLYINGLLVEINSFIKDAESAMLWDGRFKQSISEIKTNDVDTRWSGTPLQMKPS